MKMDLEIVFSWNSAETHQVSGMSGGQWKTVYQAIEKLEKAAHDAGLTQVISLAADEAQDDIALMEARIAAFNAEFGKKQEVMRVTSFEPVSGSDLMDITKSATPDFEVVSKSLWKPVSIFKGIV